MENFELAFDAYWFADTEFDPKDADVDPTADDTPDGNIRNKRSL